MSAEAKAVGNGLGQTGSAAKPARRRPQASTVAWGIAAAILLVMLAAYAFSMHGGGMNHSMSGDTVAPQDPVAPGVTAPVAGDQMVMPDGSVMDMGQHPVESTVTTMTGADNAGPPAVATDQGMNMDMGGAVNWYLIGGILAVISALVAVVAGLKEHLARRIATGTLAIQGVSHE